MLFSPCLYKCSFFCSPYKVVAAVCRIPTESCFLLSSVNSLCHKKALIKPGHSSHVRPDHPSGSSLPIMQYYHTQRNLAFSSPSSSPLESPVYGTVAPDEQLDTKVQLRNRLNNGRLSNMPVGFPFRHVVDGRGVPRISYEPYEFREELRSESRRSGHLAAYVSFTPATADSRHSKKEYLSWSATLPKADLRPYSRGPPRESTSSLHPLHSF